jgi:predicted transposase/invertase (TIGR01784 family)
MHHKDIVSKNTLKRLVLDMATYLFELDLVDIEILSEEHQRIETRRADLVVSAKDREGAHFILHIEVQNQNDATMPIRMMRYYSDIALAHPNQEIRQYLIYIGRAALSMQDGLSSALFDYRYRLLDMHRLDCEKFFQQDNPDALIFAILCDFKGRPEKEVIHYILKRLLELTGDNPAQYREYLGMLEILSTNRDLKTDIKEAENMLRMHIEELPSYEIGMEKGLEKGMEKGMEKVKEIALNLLKHVHDSKNKEIQKIH